MDWPSPGFRVRGIRIAAIAAIAVIASFASIGEGSRCVGGTGAGGEDGGAGQAARAAEAIEAAGATPWRAPEEIARALERLAAEHRDVLSVEVLAKTIEGREIPLVALAIPGKVPPGRRPAVLVVANLEGSLPSTTELAVRAMEEILRRREEPAVRETLGRVVLYVVPQASPDGAARFLGSPRAECGVNARRDDADRDWRVDEDGPQDLDGDGEILSLRVSDPRGDLCGDPADPRILRPWKPADGLVERFRLESEGIDDDGDGEIDEDGPGGVNVARNFPHAFSARAGSRGSGVGSGVGQGAASAGIFPTSEIEARCLLELVVARPEIALAVTYGERDNLVKTPPERDGPPSRDGETGLWKEDAEAYERIGEAYRRILVRKGNPPAATAGGSFPETLYFDFGLPSLAMALFGEDPPEISEEAPGESSERPPKKAPEEARDGPSGIADPDAAREKAWLEWNDRVLEGKGFVPWRPLEHPTLGLVQIGGWRPGVRTNPTPPGMDRLVRRHVELLLDAISRLPRVSLDRVRVRDLGDGIFELRAEVANYGELPTALVQGTFTERRSPLNVEVHGDGIRVLGSSARRTLSRLEGCGGSKELRWVVQGSRGTRVRIEVRLRALPLATCDVVLEEGARL